MESALLILNMQKAFKDLKEEEFIDKLIPNIKRAEAIARKNKIHIIHVRTAYKRNKSNWPRARMNYEKMWCEENCWESEFIEELAPINDEIIISKCRFSSFYNTNLERYLYENKIEHVFIAGYATDICIRFTVVDAYNRDILVTILKDCVLSERENNEEAIEYLKIFTRSSVINSEDMNNDIFNEEAR